MPPRKQLGQILLEAGLIDEFQLKSALGYQKKWGGRLGKVLVENRFITEQALVQAIHEQTGTPTTELDGVEVPDYLIRLVPVELASRHMLLPVRLENEEGKSVEVLFLAMADPTNLEALDEIRFRTGKRTRPLLAAESDIERAIRRIYLKEESSGQEAVTGVEVSLDDEMMVVQGRLEEPPPASTAAQTAGSSLGFADPFAALESIGAAQPAQAAPAPVDESSGAASGELPEIELVDEVADLIGAPPVEAAAPSPQARAAAVILPALSVKPPATDAQPAPVSRSINEILSRVGVELPGAAVAAAAPLPPASPEQIPPVREIVRELDDRIEQLLGRLESAEKDEDLPQLMRPSHVVAALVRLLLRKEVMNVEELLEELKQQ